MEAAFQPGVSQDKRSHGATALAYRRADRASISGIHAARDTLTDPAQPSSLKSSWKRVPGNRAAPHIRQLGGKNGKLIVDEFGFGFWLESEPEDRGAASSVTSSR